MTMLSGCFVEFAQHNRPPQATLTFSSWWRQANKWLWNNLITKQGHSISCCRLLGFVLYSLTLFLFMVIRKAFIRSFHKLCHMMSVGKKNCQRNYAKFFVGRLAKKWKICVLIFLVEFFFVEVGVSPNHKNLLLQIGKILLLRPNEVLGDFNCRWNRTF